MADISPITTARFWSKVAVAATDEACWNWQGAIAGSGYGSFCVPEMDFRSVSSHRIAYRLACGEWPGDKLLVRHKCDNRKCVNPFHLETGTHLDNSKDMLDRGRQAHRVQVGEQNYNSKLTQSDVAEIRAMFLLGFRNTAIAKRFGVNQATISRIRTGGSWNR